MIIKSGIITPLGALVSSVLERTVAQGVPDATVPAQFIGQTCIVGENTNKLHYRATEINPTVWELSGPANVIEDPNNPGTFVRVGIDADGALQYAPHDLAL